MADRAGTGESGGGTGTARDPGRDWVRGTALLATVMRGGEVDSVHAGMACLVDAEGRVLWSLGDPMGRAFFRSSAKPLQAQVLLDAGAHRALGLDDADLAVICGSHAGGPEPVRQVGALLAKCGLSESHLGCGGGLADQCSGKHAGMLAGCVHRGLPLDGYLDPDHPWQRLVRDALAARCGLPSRDISLALDGCSAPTFGLPLYHMALGFARMGRDAAAQASVSGHGDGPARLFRSMLDWPSLTGEPDLRGFATTAPPGVPGAAPGGAVTTPPRAGGVPVTKGGAHGLHCAALPGLGLGFALKIADGSAAVRWPVFIGALERTGLIGPETSARMREALCKPILTRRDQPAGAIRLAF